MGPVEIAAPGNQKTIIASCLYNPGNGLTFSGTLSLETNGVLKLRGFVGLSLFGKTVTWVRPQENIKACA